MIAEVSSAWRAVRSSVPGIGGSEAAILCGSAARGDFVSGLSDVDLVLLFQDAAPTHAAIEVVTRHLESLLRCRVGIRVAQLGVLLDLSERERKEPEDRARPIPFGTAKLIEACCRVGRDAVLLEGRRPLFRPSHQQKRQIYLSGIRDTATVVSSLKCSRTRQFSKEMARRFLSQLTNACRLVLRLEGTSSRLTHSFVASEIKNVVYVPNRIARLMMMYLELRHGWMGRSEDIITLQKLALDALEAHGPLVSSINDLSAP